MIRRPAAAPPRRRVPLVRAALPWAFLVGALVLGALVLGTLPVARAADTGKQLLADLKHALKRGDEEARSAAVVDVGRLNGHLSESQAKAAAMLLRDALDEESSQAVRRLMIRALARFKNTHAWLGVILASTDDRDPVIRDQARQELLSGGTDFLDVVRRLLAEDESQAFCAELLLILRDRRKPDALPLLLDALEPKNVVFKQLKGRIPIARAAAAEAVEAIAMNLERHPPRPFGYDVGLWRKWHAGWLKTRPVASGPSVSTGGRVEEPPPYVPKGLVPNFFGLDLTSKDIVFVLDISGSVGPGGVDTAKKKLLDAVALLGSDVQVAALFFSSSKEPGESSMNMWNDGQMVPATPANKEALAHFLRGIKRGRKTNIWPALNAGLKILDHRVTAKREAKEPIREAVALVMVSDGQHNVNDEHTRGLMRSVAEKVDLLDPSTTVVHSVVLGSKDNALMHELARLGGGRYVRAQR